jgi:hypothetical protein
MQGREELGFQADPRANVPMGDGRATFAVHDEGEGVLGLYLSPCSLGDLAPALEKLGISRLLEISPLWGVRADHPSPLVRLVDRAGPIELVEPGAGSLPDSVLTDPAGALEGGGRVALTVSCDAHAIVYARCAETLREILASWIAARLRDGGSIEAPVPRSALGPLLHALPDEAWHEVRLERHRRFDVLWIDTKATVGEEPETVHAERWVGGGGRAWRDGWSW